MEVQGQLVEIFNTQEVTATFKKREFAMKTDGEYAQEIGLEVTQDKVDLLDTFKVGDTVKASFNLRGKKWHNETKGINQYFNTIQVWKLEKLSDGSQGGSEPEQPLPF